MKKIASFLMVVILGVMTALPTHAKPTERSSLEKILVDVHYKDCEGTPIGAPELVDISDFVVTAKHYKTNEQIEVPVRLLGYNPETGVAELIFPVKRGYLYDVNTTF